MTELEKAARQALDTLERTAIRLTQGDFVLPAIDALRAALAQQAEPVPIPGAIPMSQVAARSRSMPERVEALEKAREMFSPPGSPGPMFPTVTLSGCAVCGIGAGKVMGYVCPRGDCPSKVTCGGAV